MSNQSPGGWTTPPPAPQSKRTGPFKAGFLGCFGVIAAGVVIVIVIAVIATSGSKTTTPTPTASEPVATTPASGAAKTTAPKAAKPRVILSRSGNGIVKTPKFTVDDSWEIRWSNLDSGGVFQLYVYDQDGLSDVAANTQARTSDVWPGTEAGTFYVQVNATGPWKLTIVDTP